MLWPRIREVAKWTCTVVASAAVAVAVFSGFYTWQVTKTSIKQQRSGGLVLSQGLFCFYLSYGPPPATATPGRKSEVRLLRGWYWGLEQEMKHAKAWGGWQAGLMSYETTAGWALGISLMYPVLVTLVPTATLWCLDRQRFGRGKCGKCGYDRRGLTPHAKCPECGTLPAPASK